ncbi:ABC transporter substrate-binding protein [Bordetella genomosp. 5]|uniref:Bug family tripartite tricarboxylate transporter substrate binding protein n=1 Tax=Bordetella genomosp. 5 TaxID=1395608 RepID=UPI000B9E3001|nr:tripartite tricarboxylate transporter substrate binding protein [Bordetella genomosp. 5]OZI44865.1 ABC transporter substrate-binding protein [Bordetella genomosp. 5]
MKIKHLLSSGLLAASVLGGFAQAAHAEAPVRLIVAFPPGGPVDMVGRVLAERLGKALDRQVIVENKAGANGNIGAAFVAKAPADGSVLFLTSVGAVAISPALYKELPYKPDQDFAPVSLVVNNATVFVVNPDNPAKDAADFVKRSQAASQPVAIGSSGVGSIPHLTLEMFTDASKAKVMHVPYKGAAPVINDVMGNQVAGFFGDVPGLIGHIQGGKLKALGLAAPRRHPLLPDVPTLAEQGIAGVESNNWYGLLAPAGTPPATVDKLNQAVRAALSDEATRKRLQAFGAEPAPSTAAELATLMQADRAKWSSLIERKQIRPE